MRSVWRFTLAPSTRTLASLSRRMFQPIVCSPANMRQKGFLRLFRDSHPCRPASASHGMGTVSSHDAWQRTNWQSEGARQVSPVSSMLETENEKANDMRNWFQAVMDPSRNPLAKLRPAQRFQIMATLAVMWSLIFCAMAGIMIWYPAYVAAHLVLLAIGTLVTTVVFRSAARR